MGAIASQITSLTIVYSTVYSSADQRKHQSSALLAFVWRLHRGPVNSPHKWPVTRKMFPFDDVIMDYRVFSCGTNFQTTDQERNCISIWKFEASVYSHVMTTSSDLACPSQRSYDLHWPCCDVATVAALYLVSTYYPNQQMKPVRVIEDYINAPTTGQWWCKTNLGCNAQITAISGLFHQPL